MHVISQSDAPGQLLGVTFATDQRATIVVWAPLAKAVAISINDYSSLLPLTNDGSGHWQLTTDRLRPGDRYTFLLDNETEVADPASRAQPQGISGPSQAFDSNAVYWEDASWLNPPVDEYILYEVDVSSFTPEGTLSALVGKLSHLKKWGINALLIRPVAPVPGSPDQDSESHFPFAVQATYGGPGQLQHLINACHYDGVAVVLELSCEQGNWLNTTSNNDTAGTGYQPYCIQNALMWFREFHVDALLLDDLHRLPGTDWLLRAIREQTNALTTQTGRQHYLLTEQDLTLVSRTANSPNQNLLVGENAGAYGRNDCLCNTAFSSVLQALFEREVNSAADSGLTEILRAYRKTNNIATKQADHERLKLLAGAVMVSPCVPTLFVGEDWDSALQQVTPDELSNAANRERISVPPLYRYYQSLTALRRQHPALYHLNPNQLELDYQPEEGTLLLHRWYRTDHILCVLNFYTAQRTIKLPELGRPLQKLFDSADPSWGGPGASPESLPDASWLIIQPTSIVVYASGQ